ncbi:MAG: dihydroorotase [Scrofimicrobium sp.]
MMKVLLRGGQVFLDEQLRRVDLSLVSEGDDFPLVVDTITEPGQIDPAGHQVLDLDDKLVLPGLADVHVHLREPGFSYKETIPTGTAAAARGGFTTVCAMPNLNPAPDTLEELQTQQDDYAARALVEVFPYACLTKGGNGRGELLDYEALATEAVGFSDDGFGVQSEDLMREVMTRIAVAGGIVAQHCEDLELSGDGYINDGEYARRHGHIGKPGASEWTQLERDLRLVQETGCDYHACHVSTTKSVELIREAKAKGLPVTAEAAPHYLVLSDDMLQDNGRFRMNPPIRSRADMEAVAGALVDGTIDLVATDHAPHSAEEKDVPLKDAANGVVGLEVSVPVIYTHFVRNGRMTIADFIRVMNTAGRARFKLGGGVIKQGIAADLIVFDPEAVGPVDPTQFLSKGHATPFQGNRLYGRVDLTICQGVPVWDPGTLIPSTGSEVEEVAH